MKHYTALVEVSKRGNPSPDEVDAVMDRLAGYPVSLSVTPRGYRAARITLPADNLAGASTAALLAVTHGYGLGLDGAVSLEVMSESEADLREGSLEVPDLIGATEAAQMLGVSPQRVRQMIEEGKLAAHRIGERSFALVRTEVEATANRARGREWMNHPGFLGLLEQLEIPIGHVLDHPSIHQDIETDGPHRARAVARYRFTVLGNYPGGKVEPVGDEGQQDVTKFDITREGEWSTPD